jgi:hypothetical protein
MTTKTVRKRSKVLHEEIGYLPTYIVDDKGPNATGTCTLLVRRYKVLRLPSGKYRTDVKTEAWDFDNATKMVDWIEMVGAKELPPEADGNPRFVPEDLRGDPSLWQLVTWGRERAA